MAPEKFPVFNILDLMKGRFLSRPNRFVGEIEYKGHFETAHIHDPGRLKELLVKGADVLFTYSNGKLKYYIKAVWIKDEWVLIDTALHSNIAMKVFEFLPEFSNVKEIRKEEAKRAAKLLGIYPENLIFLDIEDGRARRPRSFRLHRHVARRRRDTH